MPWRGEFSQGTQFVGILGEAILRGVGKETHSFHPLGDIKGSDPRDPFLSPREMLQCSWHPDIEKKCTHLWLPEWVKWTQHNLIHVTHPGGSVLLMGGGGCHSTFSEPLRSTEQNYLKRNTKLISEIVPDGVRLTLRVNWGFPGDLRHTASISVYRVDL